MSESWNIDQAKSTLEKAGYVVLKEKSYRAAQERHRVSQALLQAEKEASEGTRSWAHAAYDEQRRLSDRLNFVYGVARAHGATIEELSGKQDWADSDTLREATRKQDL